MFDEVLVSMGAGVAAGLGVAMPLGAIGTLILREGVVQGFRVAAAAAAGVATVDGVYCAVAAGTGSAFAPALGDHRGIFLCVSGLLVVGIGARQLVLGLRRDLLEPGGPVPASPLAVYGRFVGLTAINPLTLVYFVALAGAVTTRSGSWLGPIAFVVAVGLSSLAWQMVLASVGSLFRRALSARSTKVVGVAAAVLVIGLGISVLLSGVLA
jgi:threonine/homoserine/homoserine lactone efflux protein